MNENTKQPQGPPIPPGLISTNELCNALGIERTRLSRFRAAGLVPDFEDRSGPGRPKAFWSQIRVRDWLSQNAKLKVVADSVTESDERTRAELDRLLSAQSTSEVTFDEACARANLIERLTFNRHVAAIREGDELAVQTSRRAWIQAAEQVRRMERDAPEIRKAKSELVERAKVESEMTRMCLTVKQQMFGLKNSLPILLVGRTEAEMSAVIERAVRESCIALSSGDRSRDEKIDRAVAALLSEKAGNRASPGGKTRRRTPVIV